MNKLSQDERVLRIQELLTRSVSGITEDAHLRQVLSSTKKLRIKYGIDPTGPNIHIGRAIPLWKLRAFQDLGHTIVLIVGDFTAQIGDASDKLKKRPMLTAKQTKEHAKGYFSQIGKIIDCTRAEFRNNSEWLGTLGFAEIAQLAESFTVQQMLARRNFKDRWEKSEEISLRELLYPLMQGYDSVAVKADVELGGTDQLFNLHAGRAIQQFYGKPPQDILTTVMLEGLDGRKMSTSWGNVININDPPDAMYGKIMSMHDGMMPGYFEHACPHLPLSDVQSFKEGITSGSLAPRDAKMRLAREIVTLYHDASAADKAEQTFIKVFRKKEAPSDMRDFAPKRSPDGDYAISQLIAESGLASSRSDAKRLMAQGGVTIDGTLATDPKSKLSTETLKKHPVIQVGPRKFIRIIEPI